jgi:hypothetical protein
MLPSPARSEVGFLGLHARVGREFANPGPKVYLEAPASHGSDAVGAGLEETSERPAGFLC